MKPSAVIQCRRCQRYSHTAGQCAHRYRCAKCITEHEPGCCPRNTNPTISLGCINCHEAKIECEPHSANDIRNCPFFQRIDRGRKTPKLKEGTTITDTATTTVATELIENESADNKTKRLAGSRVRKQEKTLKPTNEIGQDNNIIIQNTPANNPYLKVGKKAGGSGGGQKRKQSRNDPPKDSTDTGEARKNSSGKIAPGISSKHQNGIANISPNQLANLIQGLQTALAALSAIGSDADNDN